MTFNVMIWLLDHNSPLLNDTTSFKVEIAQLNIQICESLPIQKERGGGV
jgi:hypothetical protein